MVRKVQIPVVGGLRKMVTVPEVQTPGTTIAEFGNASITLAQLKAALGLGSTPTNPNISTTTPATIALGPGLSGGGPLVGSVPIQLSAPIPAFIFEGGEGGEGDIGPPGVQGAAGSAGMPGPPGVAIYLAAEDGEDGLNAVPGSPGGAGPAGATGSAGPPGVAIYLAAENGEDGADGLPGPPGPAATITLSKGAAWISAAALVAGAANIVYVYAAASGTIKAVRLLTSGGPGSCVVDIWKAPFASYPPTVVNTITAAAKPTISAGIDYVDTVLTGWTTAINAGDVLAFHLDSSATFTQISVILDIQQ